MTEVTGLVRQAYRTLKKRVKKAWLSPKALLLLLIITHNITASSDCYNGLGEYYKGPKNQTKDGVPCQRWDSQTPHKHRFTSDVQFPDRGMPDNMCRNPDGMPFGPWCYTTDPDTRWAYCGVDKCSACDRVGKRECADKSRCLKSDYICNGIRNCADGSDERKCDFVTCEKGYMLCEDKKACVNRGWLCDGRLDCPDSSDERNCEYICPIGWWQCGNIKQCVKNQWICDGYENCRDNSDEQECLKRKCTRGLNKCLKDKEQCVMAELFCDGEKGACKDGLDEDPTFCEEWTCAHGYRKCADNVQCVKEQMLCDGQPGACNDNSDEDPAHCKSVANCKSGYFACDKDNKCVPREWKCNGWRDCSSNGFDEEETRCRYSDINLNKCDKTERACAEDHTQCVLVEYICDNQVDCIDGSDEWFCESWDCVDGYSKCANNNHCKSDEQICDGESNCPDGSDEWNCKTMTCSSLYRKCKDNKKCANAMEFCNGNEDQDSCDDNSDSDPEYCETITCPSGARKCADNKQCAWEGWFCDATKHKHCQDGSDEDPEFCDYRPDASNGENLQPSKILVLVISTCLILRAFFVQPFKTTKGHSKELRVSSVRR